MKVVAIIQARMGSTRLPGKVMKTLCGQSVLGHVISRVRACTPVDEVVMATTIQSQDNIIVKESKKYNIKIYRGSEEDVLTRYYIAAKEAGGNTIVRVTSDCPLFDPLVLEAMLAQFNKIIAGGDSLDYLSNTLERTYPQGLDAEIFPFSVLERDHYEAKLPFQREHVTPYIYGHPELFNLRNFANPVDLSNHRWTLDTIEDWHLLEAIYSALWKGSRIFTTQEVLDFLESRPDLVSLNAHIKQKKLES
jgi:spore coat polysaccharide biosynthesis protein SpsF